MEHLSSRRIILMYKHFQPGCNINKTYKQRCTAAASQLLTDMKHPLHYNARFQATSFKKCHQEMQNNYRWTLDTIWNIHFKHRRGKKQIRTRTFWRNYLFSNTSQTITNTRSVKHVVFDSCQIKRASQLRIYVPLFYQQFVKQLHIFINIGQWSQTWNHSFLMMSLYLCNFNLWQPWTELNVLLFVLFVLL